MGRNIQKSFIMRFLIIFVLLTAIVIILPSIAERVAMFFSEGIRPDRNSIIVFKPLRIEYEYLNNFIESLKKIIIFM